MAEAKLDLNRVASKLGTSNIDGKTTLCLLADPNSHRLKCLNGLTGANLGNSFASRDQNYKAAILAASNIDQKPVQVYADGVTNELLIRSL